MRSSRAGPGPGLAIVPCEKCRCSGVRWELLCGLGALVGIFLGQILDCGDVGAGLSAAKKRRQAWCGCAVNSAWTE